MRLRSVGEVHELSEKMLRSWKLLSERPQLRRWDLLAHAFGLIVSVAILGAAQFLAIAPLTSSRQRLLDCRLSAEAIHSTAPETRAEWNTLRSQLSAAKEQSQQLAKRISVTSNEAEFLGELASLAEASGIQIGRYAPAASTQTGRFHAIEVQLTLSASFASLCRFCQGLESLQRLCQLTALQIQTTDESGAALDVELTLKIYFAPEVKATGGSRA